MDLMTTVLATLPPLLFVAAGLLSFTDDGARPIRALFASRYASLIAFAISVTSILALIQNGSANSLTAGTGPLSLGLRLDPLSVTLCTLVSFVGVIVLQFSRNYLDGDHRQGWFLGWMCFTLAAVMTLVLSGTLATLALAWVATSLSLHHLLVFYRDRPGAVLAARKKFYSARAGDIALFAALGLIGTSFDTWQISEIASLAKTTEASQMLGIAAALLGFAAVLKSAQFPSHGWLIEVMETPTPVSALLHAGIVNAGGFLIIRFADIFNLFPSVLTGLIVVGGATALIGSAVMLTQNTIKTNLAWSTVAQMGFMIMQCGFGAYSAALLHIVAHSFYKAHAFLSSGSAIDRIRRPDTGEAFGPFAITRLIGGSAIALLIFAGAAQQVGFGLTEKPGFAIFGAVITLGLAHYLTRALSARSIGYVMISVMTTSIAVAVLYFGLQLGTAWVVGGLAPAALESNLIQIGLMFALLTGFAGLTLVQNVPPSWMAHPIARRWRVHLSNGLYANALFNRLVGSTFGPSQPRKGA